MGEEQSHVSFETKKATEEKVVFFTIVDILNRIDLRIQMTKPLGCTSILDFGHVSWGSGETKRKNERVSNLRRVEGRRPDHRQEERGVGDEEECKHIRATDPLDL